MRKITREESISTSYTFNRVFKSRDVFGEVFSNQGSIEQCLLLFPTDGYFLSEKQYNALQKSLIKVCDDQSMYLSILEYKGTFLESEHWFLDVEISYDKYLQLPVYLENAIYSQKGLWGLAISHEEHAVLGGSKEFISNFKTYYPQWRQDIVEFKSIWASNQEEYKSDISWIEKFLLYIESY